MNTWKQKILHIFASNADYIEEIPIEAQADNHISFEKGYTANYSKSKALEQLLPIYAPEIEEFNYLLKIITSAIKELQETLPVYTVEENGEQKLDIVSIVNKTIAFSALTDLLCIDDTGKASKITKEELIKQLGSSIDLSTESVSVSQVATTALNNFLGIDGSTVKKANKLLQDVIKEIDLSANNVKVTNTITKDTVNKIIVTTENNVVSETDKLLQSTIDEINLSANNVKITEQIEADHENEITDILVNTSDGIKKTNKLLQSTIKEINLSKDNITVEHSNTAVTTLKPLMVDENGKITSEDSISSDLVKGDISATGFKTIVMTKEKYPNGIMDLVETGFYSIISDEEYFDVITNTVSIERREYIEMVVKQILEKTNIEDASNEINTLVNSCLIYPKFTIHVNRIDNVPESMSSGEFNTTIQQSIVVHNRVIAVLNLVIFNDERGVTVVGSIGDRSFGLINKKEVNDIEGVFTLNTNNELVYNTNIQNIKVNNALLSDDIKYNIIDEDSPITDVTELPYGWSLLFKKLTTNIPEDYLSDSIKIPLVYKSNKKIMVGSTTDIYQWYYSKHGFLNGLNLYYFAMGTSPLSWMSEFNMDISAGCEVSQESALSDISYLLAINTNDATIKKIPKQGIIINKYFNLVGSWIETLLPTNQIMLEGYGTASLSTRSSSQYYTGINFPKRLSEVLNVHALFKGSVVRDSSLSINILENNVTNMFVYGKYSGAYFYWSVKGILA